MVLTYRSINKNLSFDEAKYILKSIEKSVSYSIYTTVRAMRVIIKGGHETRKRYEQLMATIFTLFVLEEIK